MNHKAILRALPAALVTALCSTPALAGEVEVLHWWTSGGEALSAAELQRMLEEQGHTWKDFAVAGGGGESAMTVLKSRVVSGNPPTAAQIKGPAIQEWGDEGVLATLDQTAEEGNWDQLLPQVVSEVMKYDGSYVAVPVNVHRVNWMWANPEIFDKAGAQVPSNWEEFETAAQKIQEAGFVPLAHGGQPWQDATTFEMIVLSEGADFYQRAFVELDPEALDSQQMVEAFETLRMLQQYTDEGAAGRDWNLATSMVINDRAAMQLMGDWAKGEFVAADQQAEEDFLCVPAPGTQGAYLFNIDSFVMFDMAGDGAQAAQRDLAKTIMSPEFQKIFNLNKGSIPARTDVAMDEFDPCGKASAEDFQQAADNDTLLPSMAHGMAVKSAVQGAIYDTVTGFYNSDISPEAAAEQLARAVQANNY